MLAFGVHEWPCGAVAPQQERAAGHVPFSMQHFVRQAVLYIWFQLAIPSPGVDMLRIVLLGAPGTGKGTQSEKLVAEYGVPQVSTGDLLRQAVADRSELGLQAKSAMDAGELVSDDIVIGMIRERLEQSDTANGFILDGFPRSQTQAGALDELLAEVERPLQRVVHLQVDAEEIVGRLMARGRADDTDQRIRNRLTVFRRQTEPLVEYYEQQGLLRTVVGVGDIDDIHERIKAALA